MTRLELNILGCGSATCTTKHLPTCQVLNVRDHLLMIDCGEGAQLSMRQMRLKFSRLNHIFISHLHGDHVFGLPGLLSTLALAGRTGTITVHTFRDGAEWLQRTMDYYCRERPFDLQFNVIGTAQQVIYEDNGIVVTAFPLKHRVPCVGFRIDEKPKLRHIVPEALLRYAIPRHAIDGLRRGLDWTTPEGTTVPNHLLTTPPDPSRSYAYCSDTMPSPRVVEAVEGVDWLYHEATYGDKCQRQAHHRYHSTAREAAIAAREAGARNLIIGHFSSRYDDEAPLLHQAQEVFPCTILAKEHLVVDLNRDAAGQDAQAK
ncbi:MAG: ribonuclease Z [Muribaculaceae bacterium]|nr:ribonuclease Z [Muribaculaceae bacterium]